MFDLNTSNLIDENVDKAIEDDIESLCQSGFNRKMVKKVYVLFKPKNKDEARDLLLKNYNNKYNHEFVEKRGHDGSCFICDEGADSHIHFRTRPSRNSTLENKDNKKIEKELEDISDSNMKLDEEDNDPMYNEDIICAVCNDNIDKKEIKKNILPCKHFFCSECFYQYLKNKIQTREVAEIKCPQNKCETVLDEQKIISILGGDDDSIQKYKRFKNEYNILKNDNKALCTYPNCDSYAEKIEGEKFLECKKGHKFCTECDKGWHKGKECEILIADVVLKKCPDCKAKTEKALGCSHMKCNCGCNWCWLCEQKFENEIQHYGVTGPCYNLQFLDYSVEYTKCKLRLYQFGVAILRLIILIFIIPALIVSLMVRKKIETHSEKYNEIMILRYISGIMYSLANIGICTIFGVPFFIISLFSSKLRNKVYFKVLDVEDRES